MMGGSVYSVQIEWNSVITRSRHRRKESGHIVQSVWRVGQYRYEPRYNYIVPLIHNQETAHSTSTIEVYYDNKGHNKT